MAGMKSVSSISLAAPLLLAITVSLAPIDPSLAAGENGYSLFHSVILRLEHQYGRKVAYPEHILEDLKSYRKFDPKNIGDPEVDGQLDELISISNINIKNCNPEYYEKLGQVENKYSLLTQFIMHYVRFYIRQQYAECNGNVLQVFANTVNKINVDQKKIIDEIRESIRLVIRRLPIESTIELTSGLVYFIKFSDEGKKIFGELNIKEDKASYGQLFKDKLVDNLCKPIVKELKLVASIGMQQKTSLILHRWLENHSICSQIVEQADELIEKTYQKLL